MKNKSSKWKRMLPTELKLIGSVTTWTCTGTLVCRHCRVERKSLCALPMSPPGTPYCRSFCSANNETIFEKIGLHVSFPSVSFDTIPGRTSISCPTWWKNGSYNYRLHMGITLATSKWKMSFCWYQMRLKSSHNANTFVMLAVSSFYLA